MLDNRNTADAPLDAEDWQIVFEPYAPFPILALILAQHLTPHSKTLHKVTQQRPQPQ